eukprot:7391429-Prymnesium_polylepis.1
MILPDFCAMAASASACLFSTSVRAGVICTSSDSLPSADEMFTTESGEICSTPSARRSLQRWEAARMRLGARAAACSGGRQHACGSGRGSGWCCGCDSGSRGTVARARAAFEDAAHRSRSVSDGSSFM